MRKYAKCKRCKKTISLIIPFDVREKDYKKAIFSGYCGLRCQRLFKVEGKGR